MKVLMYPTLEAVTRSEGGLNTVIRHYHRLASQFGIEFVEGGEYDVEIVHAASKPFENPGGPNVSMIHGLYWANSGTTGRNEMRQNQFIIDNLRHARVITTPSNWVAQTIRKDMRRQPIILPHGIDWEGWQHEKPNNGYVLWNKNRISDVCSPEPVNRLAFRNPELKFLTTYTFRQPPPPPNVIETGIQPHDIMKALVQECAVYLATAQETWGIGTVEAMAAGKPVLAFRWGNNDELVQHGVSGYLARPGDWDDLTYGLAYCLEHAEVLGENGRQLARQYTWEAAMDVLVDVCRQAMKAPQPEASVVIPCYNKEQTIGRAVQSALAQDAGLKEVIVVDDGSTDSSRSIIENAAERDRRVRLIAKANGGVASARNAGVEAARSDFVVVLDGDDHIAPNYISTCLPHLLADNALACVYTGLRWTDPDGRTGDPDWPAEYDMDDYIRGKPQVSTCSMIRRDAWLNLGGQRSRYCHSMGAGSEDAEFYFRLGAYGYGFKKVTDEPLFFYSSNIGITSREGYAEPDWRSWHSFHKTGRHGIASLATPSSLSHPAIAQDRPKVSVIIPCGPGHEQYLVDALDSLDGQSYQEWEAIVVNDTGKSINQWLSRAYPHVRVVTSKKGGAGAARNLGVNLARADLIYFLDADDYLKPDTLEHSIEAYAHSGGNVGIYSDYYAVNVISPEEYEKVKRGKESVEYYDENTGKVVVYGVQPDYNCEIAQAQPTNPPYFWAVAMSLMPRWWHYDIGGFDEEMPTWEDNLYFTRMARSGKCFLRLAEPLYVYNLNRGTRRQLALDSYKELQLFELIKQKRGEIKMGCNCKENTIMKPKEEVIANHGEVPAGFVMAMYAPGRAGRHMLWGLNRHSYGHRQHGDIIPVKKSDVKSAPGRFVCPHCERPFSTIDEVSGVIACQCQVQQAPPLESLPQAPNAPGEPTPLPEMLVSESEPEIIWKPAEVAVPDAPEPEPGLSIIPGVGDKVVARLAAGGITTFEGLAALTPEEMKGYGIFGSWPKKVKEWLSENGY